ncbi:PREDICTED: free fatty acid receptor 4-like [Branchiostoma belcheri]|uniref:Free fatty acid receptor 4-like n=1 Tax=Branchiostoma belcheri TaxID=7741 RepID=A0A6P4YJX9_BRABE|nr:PREDICTED: free fatty acid receptor 4-like [Branchiostoma belcheri]
MAPYKSDYTRNFSKIAMGNMSGVTDVSYFHDYDDIFGNRSFFTFLSEFQRGQPQLVYVEVTMLIVIMIAAYVTNIILVLVLTRDRQMHNWTNYLIVHLCCVDILLASAAPFIAAARITQGWTMGSGVCHGLMYTMTLSATVTMWTMVLISIERCHTIVKPFKRGCIYDKLCFAGTLAVVWAACGLYCLPLALYFKERTFPLGGNEVVICTLEWPAVGASYIFTIPALLLTFCIPLVVISVNYYRVFKTFWKSRARLKTRDMPLPSLSTDSRSKERGSPASVGKHHKNLPRQTSNVDANRTIRFKATAFSGKDVRVVKVLVMLVVTFFLMWLPVMIMILLIQLDGENFQRHMLKSHHFVGVLCFTLCNAILNPVFYGLLNESNRNGLRKLFIRT